MKRFLRDILTPTSAGEYGRAEWTLHWLLAATIVLPLVDLWRRRHDLLSPESGRGAGSPAAQPRHRLRARPEGARDHRARVALPRRDAQRCGRPGHPRQRGCLSPPPESLTDILPQFADIWIVDANGRPVVSGTVFPIPRELDLSDRDYFRAHANNEVAGSLHRRRGDVARHQRARPAALLCAQPQAGRRGRPLRRRRRHLDLARLFPRVLRDADAAARRRADPRRRRRAGALSGAAAGRHPADAGFHRAARAAAATPAPSRPCRRSTARSASSPSASCRASTST